MANLPDLEAQYLASGPGAAAIYSANTQVQMIRDGSNYFAAILTALQSTQGQGDVIYIVGWRFDPKMDLMGRPSTDPAYQPLGPLLAQKASVGVDVRLVLNGNLSSFQFYYGFSPFTDDLEACQVLRALQVPGSSTPPLQGRVLFDWSGAVDGSQHQKVTIVKAGTNIVAFAGGMDFWPNRWDTNAHNTLHWNDGSRWGWHDVGVQLTGAATEAAWQNFQNRWNEAQALPPQSYQLVPAIGPQPPPGVNVFPFNPTPLAPPPGGPPQVPNYPVSSQSVQIMRSRFQYKKPNLVWPGGDPWIGPPTGGIYEVFLTLQKAIGAAQQYIYIEDQFLDDSFTIDSGSNNYSLLPALREAAQRNVKVILVSSGKSDPDDVPSASLKNQDLTPGVTNQIVHFLPPAVHDNIVVWRVENCTVHSKLAIIDDCFIAVGSANIQSRSMMGVDYELHVSIVDTSTLVRDFRVALWAEHLRVPLGPPDLNAALEDITLALGIWRPQWLPSTAPAGMWRNPDNPPGFRPTETALALVGPPAIN